MKNGVGHSTENLCLCGIDKLQFSSVPAFQFQRKIDQAGKCQVLHNEREPWSKGGESVQVQHQNVFVPIGSSLQSVMA